MSFEEKEPLPLEDEAEADDETDTVSGDMEEKEWNPREKMWIGCIWARYLLPLFTVIFSFLIGCFYNVGVSVDGKESEISVVRLYGSTLVGTHEYLGGKTVTGHTWFYGLLSAGAVIGILLFLAALFLTGLAAYTAVRAFRAGYESEESNRMKMIFKVPFPNRVWLYLSNLLVLLPLLYPYFVSYMGGRFLEISSEGPIVVLWNVPLIVCTVLCLITLGLALAIPRMERAKHMNMFLLCHNEELSYFDEEDEADSCLDDEEEE